MRLKYYFWAWGLLAALECAASPAPLDTYLADLRTLRAGFTQTLVDARGQEADRSSGTLIVVRPGKFRWEVKPQGAEGDGQLMVADGRNVWFWDRDLDQVTVKPADAALSATPAMLLSGSVDVHTNFKVGAAGARDGLEWVLVEPLRADAEFRRALLGFKGSDLARMIVDDKLGQTATVSFEKIVRNGAVQPDEVSFTPPAGVDVIGKPVP